MAAGVTYTPIANYTFVSATNVYTFTSIPQTYTDLIVVLNAKSSSTIYYHDNILWRFNGDSSAIYSNIKLSNNGTSSAAYSNANTGASYCGQLPNSTSGVSTYDRSTNILQIMSYASTSIYKTVLSRSAATDSAGYTNTELYVGTYRSTSAITSLTMANGEGNFVIGTTISLYGIAAA
jgi:hypothetical protein